MTLQQTTRGRHRADVRPITFLSDIRSSKVVRNSTVGVATAGLAFGLVAPAATAADYGPDPSASTQGASSSQGASNATASGATHTVSSGDTVAKIAAQYGASTRAVIEANGLGSDALIFPGDELTIPGASGSSSTQRGTDTASRDGQRSEANVQQASNSTTATGNAIVDTARQYVGTPYVWGGSTPAGFDCSGFTSYVFAQVGIDLPRNSGAQRGAGQIVSASEARPGDLVWWPGHIGIYTGDGNHIAARNPSTALHEGPIHRANPTFIRVA